MMGVAIGEAALDAAMAVIGLAVLPGNHANDFLAAHFGLEGAADAAIGAGGDLGMLRLADLDDGLLRQSCGRTGLHAGAAGDAFRLHEGFVHAGGDARIEAAAGDRQRESALHFLAGAHAAITDDALRRVVGEIGVQLVLRLPVEIHLAIVAGEHMVGAVIAVTHVAQAHGAGHVLQLAVAVGGAGQTVERMVGDIKLHHAAADGGQTRGLGLDRDAMRDRRGAGGRRAVTPLDLDHAQAAGAEGLDAVGGAELGDLRPGLHRRAHDRRARRNSDAFAVNGQGDHVLGFGLRGPVICLFDKRHGGYLTQRLQGPTCGSPRENDEVRFRPDMARNRPMHTMSQISSCGRGL